MRSYHKTLKMARTIADLNGRDMILERDLMMAVGFRLPEISEEEKNTGREFDIDKKITPAFRWSGRKQDVEPDEDWKLSDDSYQKKTGY